VVLIEKFKDATIGFSGYARLLKAKSSGFGYIALVLLVVITVFGIRTTVEAKHRFADAAQSLAAGPDFALQNGEVKYTGAMPYRIDQGNGAFIIVDTTGQTTANVLKNAAPGSVLITKNTLYQVPASGPMQTIDLRQIPISVTKQDIMRAINSMWIVVAFSCLLVYAFQLGTKALDACILALVAMAYGSSRKRTVPFETGFKAGLYAMTISILIQWLWPAFTTFSWRGFFIWWGISIIYVIFGMRASFDSPEEGPEIPTM
jgi:hypothetical protein